jgi:endoglycosylceramidase
VAPPGGDDPARGDPVVARSGPLGPACLSLSLLVAAVAPASPALAAPPLHVEGRHFKDDAGRTVVLRGVNVAGNSKVPPFMPAADPAIFDPLPAFGMNVVRLLFTWEAYEPTEGVHEEAYLDYHAAAARAAWERGLYVIVDFHQDAFSRYSVHGCGDGFPAWALPPALSPALPDNGPGCASWGVQMQSDKDMMAAWTAFHSDAGGVKTRYLAMLESVSERLAAEPGVIGYDLMNEPWGDEVADLGPFYEDAAAALRKASPEAIVFVSPHARTSAGSQTGLGRPAFGNLAYSPHFYDASVLLFKSWSGVEPDAPFETMDSKAEEWGVPLFVGEFGAPAPTAEVEAYMNALYRRLDDRFASGAQWVYTPGWTEAAKDGWNDEDLSIVDGAGKPRANFLVRPYAPKIAGAPTAFRVKAEGAPEEREIELEWEHDPAAGLTEVFVPAAFFNAETVAIDTSGGGLQCFLDGLFMKCSSPIAGPKRARVRKGAAAPEPAACGLVGIELALLWPLWLVLRRRARRSESRPRR